MEWNKKYGPENETVLYYMLITQGGRMSLGLSQK